MRKLLLKRKTVVPVIVACTLAVGCASNPPPVAVPVEATTALLSTSTELPVQSWFLEARDIVAEALDTDLSQIELQVTDPQGIKVHAKSSLLGALEHDLENPRFAENLVDNILIVQTESVLAIYAPDVKRILLHDSNLEKFLSNQNAAPKQALQALMIHELVHAADDKKYNAFKQGALSYQEVFAKSAVIEGHAQWQTRRICETHGCSLAFEELNRYMFNSGAPEDPALQYVQSRSFKNLEFVYKEGERFIDQIQQRRNSNDMLQLAFKNPPRDSIQIIDPDSFPDLEREARNDSLSAAIENAEKPWNKHSTGSLKRNILAAAAFATNPTSRQPVVNFYTSKILAATKHEYYEHASSTPIPVAVIALQTDTDQTARETAALIFESTLSTYSQLKGDVVDIDTWQQDHLNTEIQNKYVGLQKIEMRTASTFIRNGLVDAAYPVEVVTATSGNYLVHIDGRYVHGDEDLQKFAGRLLLSMQHGNH